MNARRIASEPSLVTRKSSLAIGCLCLIFLSGKAGVVAGAPTNTLPDGRGRAGEEDKHAAYIAGSMAKQGYVPVRFSAHLKSAETRIGSLLGCYEDQDDGDPSVYSGWVCSIVIGYKKSDARSCMAWIGCGDPANHSSDSDYGEVFSGEGRCDWTPNSDLKRFRGDQSCSVTQQANDRKKGLPHPKRDRTADVDLASKQGSVRSVRPNFNRSILNLQMEKIALSSPRRSCHQISVSGCGQSAKICLSGGTPEDLVATAKKMFGTAFECDAGDSSAADVDAGFATCSEAAKVGFCQDREFAERMKKLRP